MTDQFRRDNGVLPDQAISKMLERDEIEFTGERPGINIQPGSLDLRLGNRVWRMPCSQLPGPDGDLMRTLEEQSLYCMDLTASAVLETGCIYICEIQESLDLPQEISAKSNPKSTTGRLDLFCRLQTRHSWEFDRVAAGYSGSLWLEVSPRTFPVRVKTGQCLSQIRFLRGDPVLVEPEDGVANPRISLSVDLSPEKTPGIPGEICGWRARRHTGCVDLRSRNEHEILDFWEPVAAESHSILLEPGSFYILRSREEIPVPPTHAAEMTAWLPSMGEFRAHHAGFFDPGFGHEIPSRSVLEVRCHEIPFRLRHGQPVAQLVFERMTEIPHSVYGTSPHSSYQGQGLRLAKQFKKAQAPAPESGFPGESS